MSVSGTISAGQTGLFSEAPGGKVTIASSAPFFLDMPVGSGEVPYPAGNRTFDYPGGMTRVSATTAAVTYAVDDSQELVATPDELRVGGEQFGFSTLLPDNSQAFTRLNEWVLQSSEGINAPSRKVVIELPAGIFYVRGGKIDLTWRGDGTFTPRFTFRGAGKGVTILRATPDSTAPAVLEIAAGFSANVTWEDMTIEPRAGIWQDACHIYATRRTLDSTGGVTDWTFRRLGVNVPNGDGFVFVGGDDFLGPNQFMLFEMCTWIADVGSAIKTFGQFGQANFVNGEYAASVLGTSAAPSMVFTQDYRATVAPTGVNTGTNIFTAGALEITSGTPVRIIGTGLPSGYALNTTYFFRRQGIASGVFGLGSLHATRAAVASDTRVPAGTTGTLGNWFITPFYVMEVADNALRFEFPHHMTDAGVLRFVGTGLPAGFSTGTDYFVIRLDAYRVRLASTKNNALAGTFLPLAGGTLTTFGMSAVGANLPYSVHMSCTSVQNSLQGIYVGGGQNFQLNLHIENIKNTLYLYQSQATLQGGIFANPADDSGNGALAVAVGGNARFQVDGSPFLSGTVDRLVVASESPGTYLSPRGTFVNVGASTTTGPQSVNLWGTIAVAATIDTFALDRLNVNTSATQITNISSRLGPGAEVKLRATGGSIVFATGGGLVLPASPYTLPQDAVATFERLESGAWILTAVSVL